MRKFLSDLFDALAYTIDTIDSKSILKFVILAPVIYLYMVADYIIIMSYKIFDTVQKKYKKDSAVSIFGGTFAFILTLIGCIYMILLV